MTIERTQEYRRILSATGWDQLAVSNEVFYLLDTDDGKDRGVWTFVPRNGGLEVHAAMKREYRGAYAAESVRAAFRWIFANTNHETITAAIPEPMRSVHFMARHVDMMFTGIDDAGLRCYKIEKYTHQRKAA